MVDQNGVLTANALGSVRVWASAEDGSNVKGCSDIILIKDASVEPTATEMVDDLNPPDSYADVSDIVYFPLVVDENNMRIDTNLPENYLGSNHRATRKYYEGGYGTVGPGYLVYGGSGHDIADFMMHYSFLTQNNASPPYTNRNQWAQILVYTSPDGMDNNWIPLTLTTTLIPGGAGGWNYYEANAANAIPAGTKFIKVEIADQPNAPQSTLGVQNSLAARSFAYEIDSVALTLDAENTPIE